MNVLSRHQVIPAQEEWKLAKQVLRYLKYTKRVESKFEGKLDNLEGYSDASFTDCKHSLTTSGYIIKLFGETIARKTKKQNYVPLSTCEAKYVAKSDACVEMMSLQISLNRLIDLHFNASYPMVQ